MFGHSNARERVAYAGVVGVVLFACGLVGASRIRRPSPLVIQSVPVAAPIVPSSPNAPATDTTSDEVVVHVVGAVKKPGVQHLRPGQRITDAIEAAGGAASDADLESVNLAAKAVDGSQIAIPHKGTPLPVGAIVPISPSPSFAIEHSQIQRVSARNDSSSGVVPTPSHRSGKKSPTSAVNLNTASAEELETLPGIGPATAQKILEYRSEHQRFGSIDELMAVKGIGEKKLEKMRQWLRL